MIGKTVGQTTCRFQSGLEFEWILDFSSQYVANMNANISECLLQSSPLQITKGSSVGSVIEGWRIFLHYTSTSHFSDISIIAGLLKDRDEDDDSHSLEGNISLMDGSRQKFDGACVLDIHCPEILGETIGEQYKFARMIICLDFDESNDPSRLLTSDILIVACKIYSINSCTPLFDSQNLHDDFENLFELLLLQPEFGDVTFQVQGKEIRANRGILSVRSKAFHAMFTDHTRETQGDVIHVIDFSYDIMKELIRFIYCEKVEHLDQLALNLIIAAEKYDIPALKSMCAVTLLKSLSLTNICEIFVAASISNCIQLRAEADKFIQKNLPKIVETPGFKRLEKSNPTFMADMITSAVIVARNEMMVDINP
ncbi:hypothetical protein QAD02_011316 [Eretmocerus hayati]|uniref:Uncharacterized protein n=1 Tax=Eretmocerus hayati TaxID=131215 RepID=A0ACC2NWG0_9HYME|nr:hypothetical protein QAD02_011316 [Eretmocerus hayati]